MATSKQTFIVALRRAHHAANGRWTHLEARFLALRTADSTLNRARCLSTTSYPNEAPEGMPIQAADEIDFKSTGPLPMARPVPGSPSYFSRIPIFNDKLLHLENLMRAHSQLPTIPASQVNRVAWKTIKDFRQSLGEHMKESDFNRCITLVKRLHQIHPDMKPREVKLALKTFEREIQPFYREESKAPIDKLGRALGAGRRKASTARAWLVEGTGEIQINSKSLSEFFGRVHDRESAVWALQATERLNKYNVWALVKGGGTTGQAEALTLAIAKALLAHEPALKPALRKGKRAAFLFWFDAADLGQRLLTDHPLAGCVTRDPRRVERKKHGHVKARKSPTWVKR